MYPVDAIKTRMQLISSSSSNIRNGVLESTYRIAAGEGILNLWRGMSSVVLGAGQSSLDKLSACPSCRLGLVTDVIALTICRTRACCLLCYIRGCQARYGRK